MHIRLTDVLTCPHCGPEWPLILLAEATQGRRVLAGTLGCPNCRAHFPVSAGFADLRPVTDDAAEESPASAEDALLIAALLGITEGPALALVAGAAATNAAEVARIVPGLEVIAAWGGMAGEPEQEGVTRLAIPAVLPFRSASLRGIALTDAGSESLIEEAARVVAPRGRVVVLNGSESVAERLARAGLQVMARDARATVALRAAF